jgi:hypothetical protein
LQNITIPNSVTSIGKGAFYGCESLQSIDIPSSVTSIGDNAFLGCSSLQNLSIPEGVTYFEGIVEDENEEDITEDSFGDR